MGRLFGLVCFSKVFIDTRGETNEKRGKIQERVEDIKGQGSGESTIEDNIESLCGGLVLNWEIPGTTLCGLRKGKEDGRPGAKLADAKDEFVGVHIQLPRFY